MLLFGDRFPKLGLCEAWFPRRLSGLGLVLCVVPKLLLVVVGALVPYFVVAVGIGS